MIKYTKYSLLLALSPIEYFIVKPRSKTTSQLNKKETKIVIANTLQLLEYLIEKYYLHYFCYYQR